MNRICPGTPPLAGSAPLTEPPADALAVSIGQHSDKGRKESNQDFHGALVPRGADLALKGIAVALADGISSSGVSRVAAESAVGSFLADYYCTSHAWTVKTSAGRVISAANSWLHAETRRSMGCGEAERGYVCAFAAVVLKARLAHIFHVGDCRVSRLAGRALEPLTEDHRTPVAAGQSCLTRALGARAEVEIDYRAVPLDPGDILMLSTDGVHEHVDGRAVAAAIGAHGDDLDRAARRIVQQALHAGSDDNLTVQLVRIEALPEAEAPEAMQEDAGLTPPPLPEPGHMLDHYRILRRLHASSRSHVYLALDTATETTVALKAPSHDLRGDADHLRRFMMEEWVARRLDSPHVLKAPPRSGPRSHLYVVTEHVEGQTLAQWMTDHPKPDLEAVRDIAGQIARGLRAFHRLEMLHQDLRPENVLIDRQGTAKLIDFGSVRIAGVVEAAPETERDDILGTLQYTAPEYFLGEAGTPRSDLFSLGVIVYGMLTGCLPYGAGVARARSRAQQRRLRYLPATERAPHVPLWMDEALRRAVHPEPSRRQEALSELVMDLRRPSAALPGAARPLAEQNPVLFWKCVSAALAAVVVLLLLLGAGAGTAPPVGG